MKAILLAAGAGTRLRPLTDHTPKCLVPIDGVPLLGIWFKLLRYHGVDDVLINTHHLADQVREFVNRREDRGLKVTLFHEPKLLGSGGTIRANKDFVKREERFLILYADNLTDVDLGEFLRLHVARKSFFTMGLFTTPEPRECGIAALDADDRIVEFVEKPEEPKSNLANSGLYVATPGLFELMPDREFIDFGFDVLPLIAGEMFGYRIRQYFCDLGTPERLERARREWPLRERGPAFSQT
ncbi:MAG: nucleotidyltransferase family protein [bacterium]